MNNIEIIILSILMIFLNLIFTKYNIFVDKIHTSRHKQFIVKKNIIPITGGIYLILGYLITDAYIFNFKEFYYLFIIFFLGYLSDTIKNFLPIHRLIFQGTICFLFLLYFEVKITDVRIEAFNNLLNYILVSYLFSLFCILVLMNGSNFMDGINLLSIGYFILILISVLFLSKNNGLLINIDLVQNLLIMLSFLFFMNMFNKIYLGDNGIYLLSFIVAILLIKFYSDNNVVSPYYIISLLWYPCFENLFSIIRKRIKKIDPQTPDNLHLHHLLYKKLSKIKSSLIRNNLTGFIILFFNIPIFLMNTFYYNHTKIIIFLIFTSVAFYLISYFFLKKSQN